MIHIAICDDEPVQVRLLSQLVVVSRVMRKIIFTVW